jgi:hypothetical protein
MLQLGMRPYDICAENTFAISPDVKKVKTEQSPQSASQRFDEAKLLAILRISYGALGVAAVMVTIR